MLDFIGRYKLFIAMLAVWLIVGIAAGPAVLAIIPVCVILMHRKKMYPELIMGFFFLIVLSDSRQYYFFFAKNAKNLYLIMMALILIFDNRNFRLKAKVFYPFLPFLFFAFGLVAISPIQFFSLQKTIAYSLMFVAIPNYVLRIMKDRGEEIFKDIILFFTFVLMIGIIMIPILPDIVYLKGRFTGILGNPNGVGIFCTVFFLLLTLIIHRNPRMFNRNELIFIYGILLFSMYLAVSRNAIFSIILFIVFLRFYKVSYWYGFV
ncbi:MAG: hypothetical protein HKN22_04550, partial [Bacteroidia bacterium]|nr:hypothetical protein [Bacteroidia bacterium]